MSLSDACWEGYEAYGFKIKNGRKVPNCVPIKKNASNSSMPFFLELGSDGHKYKDKAIVVSSMTGRHHSLEPIPMKKAKAQKRLLEQVEKEKTK